MKTKYIILFGSVFLIACHTTKTATTTASTQKTEPATSTPTPAPVGDSWVFTKPAEGTYPPGEKELAAIQLKFKEATMDQLKQGHTIYTAGACKGCHGAANIFQYGVEQWKGIIDDMSARAQLSDADKDAVSKYIMSIKAVQDNQPK